MSTVGRPRENGEPRRKRGSRGQSWEHWEEESEMAGQGEVSSKVEGILSSLWELSGVYRVSLPKEEGQGHGRGTENTERRPGSAGGEGRDQPG